MMLALFLALIGFFPYKGFSNSLSHRLPLSTSKDILSFKAFPLFRGKSFSLKDKTVVLTEPLLSKKATPHQVRKKFLLIVAWAHWCGPCLRELSEIEAMKKKWEKSPLENKDYGYKVLNLLFSKKASPLNFLPISIDNHTPLSSIPSVSFPLYKSPEFFQWMHDNNHRSIPALFLVSPQGKLVYSSRGSIDWEELYKAFSEAYLKESRLWQKTSLSTTPLSKEKAGSVVE